MPSREHLLQNIDDFIGELKKPLPVSEESHGWSDDNVAYALGMLSHTRRRLLKEEKVSVNLVVGMAYMGIVSGGLLDRMGDLSSKIEGTCKML